MENVLVLDTIEVEVQKEYRPRFPTNLKGMFRNARVKYGLPIPVVKVARAQPVGYDQIKEIEGKKYHWPNDEAFKVLVLAKYLLKESASKDVSKWVKGELTRIGYKDKRHIDTMCKQNIIYIMSDREPADECLLTLDERERLFEFEVESNSISPILSKERTIRYKNKKALVEHSTD